MGIGAQRNAKGTGKSEISQLQVALAVNEQILWLQIAVKNTVGVTVADSLAQLTHELLDHAGPKTKCLKRSAGSLWKRLSPATLAHGERFHILLEIKIEVFKHKVEFVTISVHDVEKANNVGVVHLLEKRDLANRGGGNTFILGFQSNLLERDDAVVLGGKVAGLVNNTICT